MPPIPEYDVGKPLSPNNPIRMFRSFSDTDPCLAIGRYSTGNVMVKGPEGADPPWMKQVTRPGIRPGALRTVEHGVGAAALGDAGGDSRKRSEYVDDDNFEDHPWCDPGAAEPVDDEMPPEPKTVAPAPPKITQPGAAAALAAMSRPPTSKVAQEPRAGESAGWGSRPTRNGTFDFTPPDI